MATKLDGMQVLDLSKLSADGTDGPLELKLTNGGKLFVHDELCYQNLYVDGRSLDHLDNEDAKNIKFNFNFKLHKDGLKELNVVGSEVRSNPLCLYHKHVWWNYAYVLKCTRKGDNGELFCGIEILSIGPTFSKKKKDLKKGAIGDNSPPNQKAPKIENIKLIVNGKENVEVPLVKKDDGFTSESDWEISKSLIENGFGDECTINMPIEITVAKSYFDIRNLIDLSQENPLVAPEADAILPTILKGDRTPKCDYVITCGQGDRRDYHVHRKVLADASHTMQIIFQTHMSIPSEQLLVVSHEDRIIMPKMNEADMKVILTYFYSRRVLLPAFNSFARLGRAITAIFPRDTLHIFFGEWQKQIVAVLLTLDHNDFYKTSVACVKHLISIFSTPYGSMPIAKRICVSVLADTLQLADASGTRAELDAKLNENEEIRSEMVQSILVSVHKLHLVAAAVSKEGVEE